MICYELSILLIFISTNKILAFDIDENFNEENQIDITCQQINNIDNIHEKLQNLEEGIYTEEALCFLKCRLLKKNYIAGDGTIYPELVKKKVRQLYNTYKSFDCLETLPPIRDCKDVKLFIECIRQ